MQLINAPGKLVLPFANAGAKNAIPVASQIGIVAGAASLTDGFPPLTRTPLAAGGVPPSGLDMNGILYELSAILRWVNAGAGYVYDGTFAADSDVGGYPKGARVLRSDGMGYWLNTTDNNTTDPEGAGAVAAGWVPDFTNGVAAVTMTGSNVTLTPLQYGKPIIVISGLLTANLNLIFPNIVGEWTVVNNTTGAYSITCKTAAGTGVVAQQSAASIIYGDATNINGFVYLTQTAADLRYAALAGLATQAFSMSTAAQFDATTLGATTAFVKRAVGAFRGLSGYGVTTTLTVADVNKVTEINAAVAMTLPAANAVNVGECIILQSSIDGGSVARAGSDVIYTGVSTNTVTTWALNSADTLTLVSNGSNAWYAVSGNVVKKQTQSANLAGTTRALGSTYTNSTNQTIFVSGYCLSSAGTAAQVVVNGVTVSVWTATAGSLNVPFVIVVPPGGTYSVSGASLTLTSWVEIK